jgi:hypothetical protein
MRDLEMRNMTAVKQLDVVEVIHHDHDRCDAANSGQCFDIPGHPVSSVYEPALWEGRGDKVIKATTSRWLQPSG